MAGTYQGSTKSVEQGQFRESKVQLSEKYSTRRIALSTESLEMQKYVLEQGFGTVTYES